MLVTKIKPDFLLLFVVKATIYMIVNAKMVIVGNITLLLVG